jgi:hypothetical protein
VLCARLGMAKVGTVTLDGTKIGANASKDANRTEEGLRKLAGESINASGCQERFQATSVVNQGRQQPS